MTMWSIPRIILPLPVGRGIRSRRADRYRLFVGNDFDRDHPVDLTHHFIHQVVPRRHQPRTVDLDRTLGTLDLYRRMSDLWMQYERGAHLCAERRISHAAPLLWPRSTIQ